MVRQETWRSLPLLSWNLRRQTLQGEGSLQSRLEVCDGIGSQGQSTAHPLLQGPVITTALAITDFTENAASLRASYTASLPCRPNSIVVDQSSHPSTLVLSYRRGHLDRATSKLNLAEIRNNKRLRFQPAHLIKPNNALAHLRRKNSLDDLCLDWYEEPAHNQFLDGESS